MGTELTCSGDVPGELNWAFAHVLMGKLLAVSFNAAITTTLQQTPEGDLLVINDSTTEVLKPLTEAVASKPIVAADVVEELLAVATSTEVFVVCYHLQDCNSVTKLPFSGITFVRFDPARRFLLLGGSDGSLGRVFIDAGTLAVRPQWSQLVPASSSGNAGGAVCTATILGGGSPLIATTTALQQWSIDDMEATALSVGFPRGSGMPLDIRCIKGCVYVLCTNAIWKLTERERGAKATVWQAAGKMGWTLSADGKLHYASRIKDGKVCQIAC